MPKLEPYAVAIARRDALVHAVLDALNVADLRAAAQRSRAGGPTNFLGGRIEPSHDLANRLVAAADALAALREAQQ
jgi:hypothetical protein